MRQFRGPPRGRRRSRRPLTNNVGAGAHQLLESKDRVGRKIPVSRLLKKLDERDTSYDVYRFGGANRLENADGAYYKLDYVVSGTAPNQIIRYPMYVFDVTQRGVGTITTQGPMNRIGASTTSASTTGTGQQITFNLETGLAADGVTTNAGASAVFKTTNNSTRTTSTINQTAILEYLDIRFVLRGATTRPGWIKISFVQFLDDRLNPTFTQNDFRDCFWGDMVKKSLFNPISDNPKQLYPGPTVKVLKQYTWNYTPDDASNKDANGVMKHHRIFWRMNRFLDYRNPDRGEMPVANIDSAAVTTSAFTTADSRRIVVERARIYMIIQGSHYDAPGPSWANGIAGGAVASGNVAYEASFDMEVRQKHVYRPGRT